jgi:hypothetical protein
MPFTKLVGSYTGIFPPSSFHFRLTDILSAVNNFPQKYGVYTISDNSSGTVLYIGKSGTVYNNYNCDTGIGIKTAWYYSNQTLKERIQAKHNKTETREQFYRRMMTRDMIQELLFACYETVPTKFPFEAEAELLSAYLRQYNCLPEWNKWA